MNVKFAIRLNKAEKNSDGKCPVVLQITFDRKVRRKSTGVWVKEHQFYLDEEKDGWIRDVSHIEEKRNVLKEYKKNAKRIFEDYFENAPFEYKKFAKLLDEKVKPQEEDKQKKIKVAEFIKLHADRIIKRGNARSGKDYLHLVSIVEQVSGGDIHFDDFDKSWINKFVKFYDDRQVNGYKTLVRLRAIYNHAIEDGIADYTKNPFYNKYTNPRGFNVTKFKNRMKCGTDTKRRKKLSKENLKELKNYKPISKKEEEYLDIWWFSYYTFGVDITDTAFMKKSDIRNGRWYYQRSKTKTRSKKQNNDGKILMPEALQLIDKYSKKNPESEYVFPILCNNYDTDVKRYSRATDYAGYIRKMGVRISKRLGWDFYFTSKSTRHSVTNLALQGGVDSKTASHLLDHTNYTTINNYVGSADDEDVKNAYDSIRL